MPERGEEGPPRKRANLNLVPQGGTAVKPPPKESQEAAAQGIDVATASKEPKEQTDPLRELTVGNTSKTLTPMMIYMAGGPCKELVSILNDSKNDVIRGVLRFEGIRLTNPWASILNKQSFQIFPVHLVLRNAVLEDDQCGNIVETIIERIRMSTDFDEDKVNELLSQRIVYTLNKTRHSYTTMHWAVKLRRKSAVQKLCELKYPQEADTGAYKTTKKFPELPLAISALSEPRGFEITKHLFRSGTYTEVEKMAGLVAYFDRSDRTDGKMGHALGLMTMVINTGNPFGEPWIIKLAGEIRRNLSSVETLLKAAQNAAEEIRGVSKDTIPHGILTIIGALCIIDSDGKVSEELLASMERLGMTKVPGLDTLIGYLLLEAALGNQNKVWFDYLMPKYEQELEKKPGDKGYEEIKALKDVFAGNESKSSLLKGTTYGALLTETPTPDPSLRAQRARDRQPSREEAIKKQIEKEARKEAEKEVAKKMARLKREEEKIRKKQRELAEELEKLKSAAQ